jgi:hypothetical protein
LFKTTMEKPAAASSAAPLILSHPVQLGGVGAFSVDAAVSAGENGLAEDDALIDYGVEGENGYLDMEADTGWLRLGHTREDAYVS